MLEWLASCGPLDHCLALSLYKTAELRFLFLGSLDERAGRRNCLRGSSRAVARVEVERPTARRFAQSLPGADAAGVELREPEHSRTAALQTTIVSD